MLKKEIRYLPELEKVAGNGILNLKRFGDPGKKQNLSALGLHGTWLAALILSCLIDLLGGHTCQPAAQQVFIT